MFFLFKFRFKPSKLLRVEKFLSSGIFCFGGNTVLFTVCLQLWLSLSCLCWALAEGCGRGCVKWLCKAALAVVEFGEMWNGLSGCLLHRAALCTAGAGFGDLELSLVPVLNLVHSREVPISRVTDTRDCALWAHRHFRGWTQLSF